MATSKTFNTAGTSTSNGVTKIRFANDYIGRFKILHKNGHENIELIELGGEFTKAQVCQILMAHDKFQSEFVLRNCSEIKAEIEAQLEIA
jgi:hypothetical protein